MYYSILVLLVEQIKEKVMMNALAEVENLKPRGVFSSKILCNDQFARELQNVSHFALQFALFPQVPSGGDTPCGIN